MSHTHTRPLFFVSDEKDEKTKEPDRNNKSLSAAQVIFHSCYAGGNFIVAVLASLTTKPCQDWVQGRCARMFAAESDGDTC